MSKPPDKSFLWCVPLALAVSLAAAQSIPLRPALDLNRLQGYWEGEGPGGKCSITITGNSLLYRAGTNWHQTTFTLPAGIHPQQLHATIKDSFPPSKDAIGQVVHALVKIEDDTLTLADYPSSEDPPKTFEDATSKYLLKRAQPKTENQEPGSAVLDEAGVLAIARAAVTTNDTWVARAKFGTPRRQPDGSWNVLVWRLPETPGGHRLITIDQKGRVIDYLRGL